MEGGGLGHLCADTSWEEQLFQTTLGISSYKCKRAYSVSQPANKVKFRKFVCHTKLSPYSHEQLRGKSMSQKNSKYILRICFQIL